MKLQLYLLGKTIPLNNNNDNDNDNNNNGLFTAYPNKKNVAPHLQRPNIEKWRKKTTDFSCKPSHTHDGMLYINKSCKWI